MSLVVLSRSNEANVVASLLVCSFFSDILRGGRYPQRRVNLLGEIPWDIALGRAKFLVITPRGEDEITGWRNPYDIGTDRRVSFAL